MPARSFLYVPGDRPDRLRKAEQRAGDAIIADLEDAVAPAAKAAALEEVRDWLATAGPGPELWVRVNPGPAGLAEIEALRDSPRLHGVVLPKADLTGVQAALAALGTGRALAPLIESARGLLDAPEVAAMSGVSHLGIGEADLCGELGITPSPDARELIPLRLQVVVASAAAGLPGPTGPVHLDVRDLDGLRASCDALRRQGFAARSAIHPDQVPVIEAAFTPTEQEVDEAQAVVTSYEKSLAEGTGVVLDARGRMVDEAVVRAARRTVALAERLRR